MELTVKQLEGLNIAVQRYRDHEPYTVISGYAGAGKSTLVRFIVSALNLTNEDVAYVAYTGKAASVLQHKGCPNATTAHKLLYNSRLLSNGKYLKTPKMRGEIKYKLIVVDEVSMLPKPMWDLLLAHQIYILACGDPFQLPPVDKDADNHILDNPHIFLDEIMRQAQESEIIRLSMDIRLGNPIQYFKGNEVQVIRPNEVGEGHLFWADQILTATNAKRAEINKRMRAANGFGDLPQNGDKVICLRNNWDIESSDGNSLVNGTIGYLQNIKFYHAIFPCRRFTLDTPAIQADLIADTLEQDVYCSLDIDEKAVRTGVKAFTSQQEYAIMHYAKMEPLIEFNYGYAITCHRAQGSEWGKVLVFEEAFPFEREEHARWLYTAVTRAQDKLVLVRK